MSLASSTANRSPLWWGLAGLCLLLLLLELLLLSKLIFGDSSASLLASESGQRQWLAASDAQSNTALPAAAETAPASAAPDGNAMPPSLPQADSDQQAALLSEFVASESELPDSTIPETPIEAAPPESFVANESELRDIIPAEPRTAASLAAPDATLQEGWGNKVLPMREGSRTPFAHYKRPFEAPATGRPMIALVISNLGAMRAQTELATELPKEATLAFNPYAEHTAAWLQSARNKGFESWLMLPAQPDSFPAGDGGPLALLAEQAPEESLERLKHVMAAAGAYSGVVLPADEAFSDHLDPLKWLYSQLDSRGLALIAAERPTNSAAQGWFRGQLYAQSSDMLIDGELTPEAIEAALRQLELQARQQGKALGVIRPYPLSLKTVKPWLEGLKARGFILAPASALFEAPAE